MSMDGRYPENAGAIFRVCGWTADICSCNTCIPAVHGVRILKMHEQFSGYVDGWTADICSCNICIATILGGAQIFAPAISA